METKPFPVRVLLTVTTGLLLTAPKGPNNNGIRDLYDLLDWMTGDSSFSHNLGHFLEECKPWLIRWFPELVKADRQFIIKLNDKLKKHNSEAGLEKWLESLVSSGTVKATYDVPRIPKGEYIPTDPVKDMVDIVGEDRVTVVNIDS